MSGHIRSGRKFVVGGPVRGNGARERWFSRIFSTRAAFGVCPDIGAYPDMGVYPNIGVYLDIGVYFDIGVHTDIGVYLDTRVDAEIGVYPDRSLRILRLSSHDHVSHP
jgi:hypothetical protein